MVVEWTTMPKGLASQVDKKTEKAEGGGRRGSSTVGVGGSDEGNGGTKVKVKGRLSLRKAAMLINMARLSNKHLLDPHLGYQRTPTLQNCSGLVDAARRPKDTRS